MSFISKEDIFAILEALPSVRGSTPDDILLIERKLGVAFPAPYRRFLEAAGDVVPAGSEMFPLSSLPEQRVEWLSSADEDNFPIPNRDLVVFFDHADMFEAYFFTADGTVDPTVFAYNYYDGDDTPIRQAKLSDFLALSLLNALGIQP